MNIFKVFVIIWMDHNIQVNGNIIKTTLHKLIISGDYHVSKSYKYQRDNIISLLNMNMN